MALANSTQIQLTVARRGADTAVRNVVRVDARVLDGAGISLNSPVEVRTDRGRRVVAYVGPSESANGSRSIHLDRHQLAALKPAFGETVRLRAIEVEPAKRVIFEPIAALDENLAAMEQQIAQRLAGAEQLLCGGMLLSVELPAHSRPVTFRVVSVEPDAAKVTHETRLVLRGGRLIPGAAANLATFADIGGLDGAIQQIRELVEFPLRFPDLFENMGIEVPRGVLLCGPPGSGKTYLAKALANEIGAHFFYINGPEIVSSLHGGTEANLREIFKDAMEHRPAIVLIDEIDAIAPARGDSGLQADVRMGAQLLSLLDGLVAMEEVVVIGTTNRIHAIDPALRRPGRFDREIILPPLDSQSRLEILHIHTRRVPLDQEASDFLPELAQRTHGYVGADLRELVREAGFTALRRLYGAGFAKLAAAPFRAEPQVLKEDLVAALARTAPSALRETLLQVADMRWSDIGGLAREIAELREAVEMPLRHPRAFAKMRVQPSNGILLHGPAGTGKTMLAKAVANECGANFLPLSGPEIFSKWLGQSEATLRAVFQTARQVAPAVIFLDQLDALAPRRARESSQAIGERIVGQLLAEMDGIQPASQVIVLAATNRKDMVDEALLRPGRFGRQIFIGLPAPAERRDILRLHLRDVPLAAERDRLALTDEVAQRAGRVSGAALAALCERAKLLALREENYHDSARVRLDHFLRALEELRLSQTATARAPARKAKMASAKGKKR